MKWRDNSIQEIANRISLKRGIDKIGTRLIGMRHRLGSTIQRKQDREECMGEERKRVQMKKAINS